MVKRSRVLRRPGGRPLKRRVKTKTIGEVLSNTVTPKPAPTVALAPPLSARNKRRSVVPRNITLPEASQAFMRAAFAPFDFPSLALEGVPDNYTGPSVVKQHCLTTTISLAAGSQMNILVLPTPGIAYWTTTGYVTDNWDPTYFADYDSCFGEVRGTRDGTFSKFRYLGAALEIRPTSAVVSNAGSITSARVPIAVTDRAIRDEDVAQTPTTARVLALNAQCKYIDLNPASESGYTQGPSYSAHVNDGLFTVAINDGCWDFEKIWTGDLAVPPTDIEVSTTTGVEQRSFLARNGRLLTTNSRLVGFGHMMAIAVTIKATSALTFTVLSRAYVEYMVDPFSVLYNMARPSPAVDPVALALYSRTVAVLPPGLPYSQNADFWARVWSFMKRVLGTVTKVGPMLGPYGVAASTIAEGVQQVGSLLEQL